jgi:hypothetical protein
VKRLAIGSIWAMTTPFIDIAAIAAIFFLAGLVKGVIGLGLPTVAMGLLGLFMAPAGAAALLILPSFVTNVWQSLSGGSFLRLAKRLWPMLAAAFIGTVWASGMIAGDHATLAASGLGVTLVVYAALGLADRRMNVSPRAERWAGPLVGVATGLITGATGVFVIPAVPYLAGLRLERDEMVQALGLSFTISTIALAVGLHRHDALPAAALSASMFAVVPALAGMAFGARLRKQSSPARFRRWFFIGLAVLGLQILMPVLAGS